jgi:[ribosomal protein S5]-alanine N-acetyltransferase
VGNCLQAKFLFKNGLSYQKKGLISLPKKHKDCSLPPSFIPMNPTTIVTTSRLACREFTVDDAAFYKTLVNTEGWLKYIGDRKLYTNEAAADFLVNKMIPAYSENGFGGWLVYEKATGNPIGLCGLFKRKGLDGVDLGFALLPAYAGKGFAFEISEAVTAWAFEHLKIDKLLAIVLPNNQPSITLLEKLGFVFAKNIAMDNELLWLMEKTK